MSRSASGSEITRFDRITGGKDTRLAARCASDATSCWGIVYPCRSVLGWAIAGADRHSHRSIFGAFCRFAPRSATKESICAIHVLLRTFFSPDLTFLSIFAPKKVQYRLISSLGLWARLMRKRRLPETPSIKAKRGVFAGIDAMFLPVMMNPQPIALLVNDDTSQLRLTASILARDGYEVLACLDAEEALARLSQRGADVIITDLYMPGIDGGASAGFCVRPLTKPSTRFRSSSCQRHFPAPMQKSLPLNWAPTVFFRRLMRLGFCARWCAMCSVTANTNCPPAS